MPYSFLTTFREGLEAALIVAIVLSYLHRVGQGRYSRSVWTGVLLALAGSLLAGGLLQLLAVELPGAAMEAIEGAAMFLAVGVLTWMIFWMRRQAATIGKHLRDRVDMALKTGSASALALLSFTAVGREGLETVLFLFAGVAVSKSALLYWLGAGLGLMAAVALGYLIYIGTARLPLKAFFTVTGVALIVLAAGLLTNGLKEFHEMGLIPGLGVRVWDTYDILPDNSTLGRALSAVFGYDSSPFMGQVVAYVGYLAPALVLFFSPQGGAAPRAQSVSSPRPKEA